MLDKLGTNLCASDSAGNSQCPKGLSGGGLINYNQLLRVHEATLQSEASCPGDGNEDKVVKKTDVHNWRYFTNFMTSSGTIGGSSWYDLNMDGFTNGDDLMIIQKNLGSKCPTPK